MALNTEPHELSRIEQFPTELIHQIGTHLPCPRRLFSFARSSKTLLSSIDERELIKKDAVFHKLWAAAARYSFLRPRYKFDFGGLEDKFQSMNSESIRRWVWRVDNGLEPSDRFITLRVQPSLLWAITIEQETERVAKITDIYRQIFPLALRGGLHPMFPQPIFVAVKHGRLDAIKLLTQNGTDLGVYHPILFHYYDLHYADMVSTDNVSSDKVLEDENLEDIDSDSEEKDTEYGDSEQEDEDEDEMHCSYKHAERLLIAVCEEGQQDIALWFIHNGIRLPRTVGEGMVIPNLDPFAECRMPSVIAASVDQYLVHDDIQLVITKSNIMSAACPKLTNSDNTEVIDILMAAGDNALLNGTTLQDIVHQVFKCGHTINANHLFKICLRDGPRHPATVSYMLKGAVRSKEVMEIAVNTFLEHFPQAPRSVSDDEVISDILSDLLRGAISGYCDSEGSKEVILYLIQKGVKPSAHHLDIPAQKREAGLIDLLVSHGAPVTKVVDGKALSSEPLFRGFSSWNMVPSFLTAMLNRSYECAFRLLFHGADYYVKPKLKKGRFYDQMRSELKWALRDHPGLASDGPGRFSAVETRLQSPDWRQVFSEQSIRWSAEQYCLKIWALSFLVLGKGFDKGLI